MSHARGHICSCSFWLKLALLLFVLGHPDGVRAQTVTEYGVKAAFLYNAPKFIDWPPEALTSASFTIGVLGDDPFGTVLDQLAGRTIKGKKVVIRRLTSLERAAECQLLFIAASEQRRLQTVLGRLRELPLLTVSDIDGFAFAGGMLELTMDRNRLTFIANNRQAKRQGLKISSQMLKLAREIVE
jgi:hypothetical protein